ncbi:MAG: tripartite tricarboxylate transporter substrate binding protein [Betaproteobacteria bacterium]|nr:tripartite tricarboxylate transporter substrate binding protein [Betaproteobacteria bacterium]
MHHPIKRRLGTLGVLSVPSVLSAALSLAAVPGTVAAQAAGWKPTRPIEFVVPAAAGGSLDRPVRLIQRIWQEEKLLDVAAVIANRAGGGQSVGYTYVHGQTADPHRLLIVSGPLVSNHITGRSKLNYTNFSLMGQLYNEYNALSVRADGAFKTTNDLLAKLKGAPDSLSVAIGTTLGNNSHISIALPFKRAGIDIRRLRTVVFPSAGESVTSLLGGHLDYVASGLSVAAPHWKAGRLRFLAVTAPQRLQGEYASIPTWKEQGIDAVVSNSRFIMGPPGLTQAQITFWDNLFRRTVASPEWKKVVQQEQWVDEYVSSDGARKLLEREYRETREILADLGMAK